MSQYQTVDKDGVFVITCPAVVDTNDPAEMEAQVKTWLLSPSKIHVLDFKGSTDFKPTAYRTFVIYNQQLRANSKNLFVVNLNEDLQNQFKQDGLTSVFISVASIEEAKKKAAPAKMSVDVEFINPFIAAARNVLETQAQIALTPGKAVLKKPDERIPMEIAGVIAMSCAEFTGSINLCFRAEVFLKIYENLTGEKHTVINSEIEDAAAEILNIIFGQAKTVLNDQKGYALDRALPTVLTGDKLRLHHMSRSPAIVIPFESAVGTFHLEILVDRG
jgi:chemotaxis protein CheX